MEQAERVGYSLHRARTPKECEHCGDVTPPGGEFWKCKMPRSMRGYARVICVLCHVLYGCPSDGWTEAPDGNVSIAQLVPLP